MTMAALFLSPAAAGADFPAASRAFDAGDYPAATELWRDLAYRCDPKAQTALAGLYRSGFGVPQNELQALRWYLTAARAGERYAQQIAGEWYSRGRAVPADPVRAAFWFTLAARQGLTWSAAQRDTIMAMLSRLERDLLDERLASYTPADRRTCRID